MINLTLVREFLQEENLSDEVLSLIRDSAIKAVEGFLGYSIEYGQYTDTGEGRLVYLSHAPIVNIVSVIADGEETEDYETIDDIGIISFSTSKDSVSVTYVGGYEALPTEMQFAVLACCQAIYQRIGSFGAKRESVQGYSVEFLDEIPPLAKDVLSKYWRPSRC